MDVVREDMLAIGVREPDARDRVKWRRCSAVATPNRRERKNQEEGIEVTKLFM